MHEQPPIRRPRTILSVLVAFVLLHGVAAAQRLTGALIGTVKDEQGGALPGAVVRVSSPALIGGLATLTTNEKGQLRFPALPPGPYVLDIELQGFAAFHEADIPIGAGATIERTPVLKVAGVTASVVVHGDGSRIEARSSGFETRLATEYLRAMPTIRASMFDLIVGAPGISPTSPATTSTATPLSAFGSGTNENQFLVDGTNFTSPADGFARAELGIDFIQEVQVQSVGASVEYGNVQGAVINVVTRQGGERFLYDASYYGQTAGLTAQPVRLPCDPCSQPQSGYARAKYRDLTTNLGGPVVRNRLWFFAGYEHLRDYDSQPGTDPNFPRTYEQDKILVKLTWRLAPGWQLVQSFHDEFWFSPQPPTLLTPFAATFRQGGSTPAMTFGHLTHTSRANTVWDVRAARFVYARVDEPSTTPNRFDSVTRVTSGAPASFGRITVSRTTANATVIHYRPALLGGDHEWKMGGEVERGEHYGAAVIPTGERFIDSNGQPSQRISRDPFNPGGLFITAAAFVTDAITVKDRLTLNAGLRFDHSRAISQDLHAFDLEGRETAEIIRGLGTLYVWNILSPRLGVTAKLTADGRTVLRASYGKFSQGVLTRELSPIHPGVTAIKTTAFDPATGDYTIPVSVVDPKTNLQLDPDTRTPRTDEYSVGVDREVGRRLAMTIAYVRKDGANFVGWRDVGGVYREEPRTLADGRSITVFKLVNDTSEQRFLLTNPGGYSSTYNGLVMAVEKRRSYGWQAFGSYTLSRASGLQPSSGTTAAGGQVSSSPNVPFGRDPNDLTNARGRLANDRPHMFRVMGSVDVPRTGCALAANLQYVNGKPWAATAQISLPQNKQQIVLLEPRGSRRLSSQTLLDVRVSRTIGVGPVGRIELILDVLNALNDAAEEGLTTETLETETKMSPTFGQPATFMLPRRAMVSVRLNLGR